MALAMNLLIGLVTYFIAFFLTLLIGAPFSDPRKSGVAFILGGLIVYTLIYFNTAIEYGEALYIIFILLNILLGTRSMKPKRPVICQMRIPEVPQQVGYVPVTHPIIHAMMKRLSIPQTFRLVGPYIYLSDDNSVLIYVHPDNPLQPSKFTLSAHKFFWLVHVAPMPKDVPVFPLSSNARIIIQHYPGTMLLRYIDEKLETLKSELREVDEILVRVTRRESPDTYISARTRKLQLQNDIKRFEELRKKLGQGFVRVILIDLWAGPVELIRFDYSTFESHVRHLVATINAAEQQLHTLAAQEGYILLRVAGPKELEEVLTFQAGVDTIPSFLEGYLEKVAVKGDLESTSRELWEKLAEILKSSELGVEHVDLSYATPTPRIDPEELPDKLREGIIPVAISVDPRTGEPLGPEYVVFFDFSSTDKARHTIIAGGTGTGKSFAAKTIITWLAAFTGIKIFIFDDGTYSGLAVPFQRAELFEKIGLPREATRGFSTKLWVVGENLLLNVLRKPDIESKEVLRAEAGFLAKRLIDIIGSKSKTLYSALFQAISHYWERGEDPDLDKIVSWIKNNIKGRSLQTIENEINALYAYRIIMHPEGIKEFGELFKDGQIAIFRAEGISDEVRALIADILVEWSREWLKKQGPAKRNRLLLVVDEAFANFKKIQKRLERWIVEARKFGGIGLFISQRIVAHFSPGIRQQAMGYLVVFKGAEKEVSEFGIDRELQDLVREGAKYHMALIISPAGLGIKNPVLARFLPPLASHDKAPDEIEEKLMGMLFKKEMPVSKEETIIVTSGWRTVFKDENELLRAIKLTSEGTGFRRLAKILGHDTPWKVRRWHEAFKILLSRGYSVSEIAELLINNSEITAMELLEFARRVSNKTSGKRLVDLYAGKKAKND